MNNFYTSAGVYVHEVDLSQRIAAASTSIGAVVGWSAKGPVMERTLILNDKQFIETFGKPDPKIGFMHYAALAFLQESRKLYVTRVAHNDALTAGAYLTVDDVNAVSPEISLNNFDDGSNNPRGIHDPFNLLGFDPNQPGIENVLFFVCAQNPGLWNNSLHIKVRPSIKKGLTEPDDPYEFYVDVYMDYVGGRQTPLESFLVSRDFRQNGFGYQMNIEEVINLQSKLIRVRNNPYASDSIKILNTASEFLDGATNGTRPTDSYILNGWELYRDPEQVDANILINAGYTTDAVQQKMDDIAQTRMDCISVLDTPSLLQDVVDALDYRRNTLNLDSSRSALYSPDIKIKDTFNDLELFVPPSGYVAALYARTDDEAECWFAPAGMGRGDLNVLGVRKIYNQEDRDALVDANINPIRVIPSSGYKVWGADTLQIQASALSNVNVRRLLNFVEKSISIAALYSVYDPNDEILRAKLREMVERFLKPIRNARGLYDFQVVCDDSNNPPEVIANGDTMLDVYLDPVIPAKRIQLNAIVTKTGANFVELAANRAGNVA